MAIGTYAELQTALQKWLARADADVVERIPEFIALAEAQFNRDIKHPRMETQATITTVGGTQSLALPTDYTEVRALVVQTTPLSVLTVVTPQQLATDYANGETGVPVEYAIIGDSIYMGPSPSGAYDITATYYQRIPSLSDAATTNWLLTYNPDMYLYGTLLQAAPYLMNDERLTVWASFYDRAMQGLKGDATRSAFNGGPLTTRVEVSTH